jgi:hypothetical protein
VSSRPQTELGTSAPRLTGSRLGKPRALRQQSRSSKLRLPQITRHPRRCWTMTMFPIPRPYPQTRMLNLPPISMPTAGVRSRDRNFLGASHRLRAILAVYYQKYNNNATDHSRSLAQTSLQRWVSQRLQNTRPQTLVLVPLTSRGSGESSSWSTQSRASDEHYPLSNRTSSRPQFNLSLLCIASSTPLELKNSSS